MARRARRRPFRGACIGSVAMPMKRCGCALISLAIWSFWMAAVVAPSDAPGCRDRSAAWRRAPAHRRPSHPCRAGDARYRSRRAETAGRPRRRHRAPRSRHRSGVIVTVTRRLLGSSAAVSSVRTWVWVSIVRTLLISSPENVDAIAAWSALSAAAGAWTQAPVAARLSAINRSLPVSLPEST